MKKILKASMVILLIVILGIFIGMNYNKDKLIEDATYKIIDVVADDGHVCLLASNSNGNKTFKVIRLEDSYRYKVIINKPLNTKQDYTNDFGYVHYKVYGNRIFHRVEVTI